MNDRAYRGGSYIVDGDGTRYEVRDGELVEVDPPPYDPPPERPDGTSDGVRPHRRPTRDDHLRLVIALIGLAVVIRFALFAYGVWP